VEQPPVQKKPTVKEEVHHPVVEKKPTIKEEVKHESPAHKQPSIKKEKTIDYETFEDKEVKGEPILFLELPTGDGKT
jgi:hypothetical protein